MTLFRMQNLMRPFVGKLGNLPETSNVFLYLFRYRNVLCVQACAMYICNSLKTVLCLKWEEMFWSWSNRCDNKHLPIAMRQTSCLESWHINMNHHALNKDDGIIIRHENILLTNDVTLILGYSQNTTGGFFVYIRT